jgi:hypothetical protein
MNKLILLTIFISACANSNIKIGNDTYTVVNNTNPDTASSVDVTHNPNPSTLINNRTGKTAIVTGYLIAELDNKNNAEIIADKYNLGIHKKFKRLNLVFFSVGEQDIFNTKELVSQDEHVNSVEIDLIENIPQPY